MNLVNMKRDPKVVAAENKEPSVVGGESEYPYGLSINLDEEGLAKLGISGLPAVGKKLMLHANVVVSSASEHKEPDGDARKNCTLQITDMALGDNAPDTAARAAKIYE